MSRGRVAVQGRHRVRQADDRLRERPTVPSPSAGDPYPAVAPVRLPQVAAERRESSARYPMCAATDTTPSTLRHSRSMTGIRLLNSTVP